MISDAFDTAWQATWPAAEYTQIGGFRVGRGLGGGGRVSTARVTGAWDAEDIAAVEAQHSDWGQAELFSVEDADERLAGLLAARGYVPTKPTLILDVAVERLTETPIPPLRAMDHWPPLAIVRDIWREEQITQSRQDVMARVTAPHIAILGRIDDRAAGVGFAAVSGRWGTIHALAVPETWRRRGVASWILRRAAQFTAAKGGDRLALAVTEANANARALYERIGFGQLGRYTYWQRD